MQRVLIATPSLTGKIDAWFVNSLYESVLLGLDNDYHIKPVFLVNESILHMARNELFNLAYQEDYDTMVFIDDDQRWNPHALLKLLKSDKNVACIPVVNKGDKKLEYNTAVDKTKINPNQEFIEVERTGTGFLKLEKPVIKALHENSPDCFFRGKTLKMICDFVTHNNEFVGEDIFLCYKLRSLGFKIWAYTEHTVDHIGEKIYQGSFKDFINEN